MPRQIKQVLRRLTLAQQFMLASLIILMCGMLGIGWWVGKQIEDGVIHRTAATTALYVDSFISPNLQDLGHGKNLSPEYVETLRTLLHTTPLGQQIVAFKVWDTHGRVLYSTDGVTAGQTFPIHDKLRQALSGKVASGISELDEDENLPQKAIRPELLETYSPVRLSGTNQIIAVAEFYQTVDDLLLEIRAAQRRSWLVVGLAMLTMYVLLAGFVQRASDTIAGQQQELGSQVTLLTGLLAQNQELHARVRRAAASAATLNESFLRRIGAELHDGPAQDLSLALLRLDTVIGHSEAGCVQQTAAGAGTGELATIETSLQHALQELRSIAAGLGLPQLENLNVLETVTRVVRAHERRTGTKVTLQVDGLPPTASLPMRITLYRLIQEALNNAYRHAGGKAQQVWVKGEAGQLWVEVSDEGPGFSTAAGAGPEAEGRLGLAGMRERVESQGGRFQIESAPGQGTKVIAWLTLSAAGESNGR